MKDRGTKKVRGLDMWLKKFRKDRKEPSEEPKKEAKEEGKVPEQEVKEPEKAAESRREPTKMEQEPVEQAKVEEIESTKTPEMEIKAFLRGQEGPFTITELTKGTNLSLKIAKTTLSALISAGEVSTRTFGRTAVYWGTGRVQVRSDTSQLQESVSDSAREEIRRLTEQIARLKQERVDQTKECNKLKEQLKELEPKELERPEEQLTSLQERISMLEEEKKELLQQNEKLKAQLIGYQTKFAGKETEWKVVAERMAKEMAARAGTSTEEVLEFFEAPGYY